MNEFTRWIALLRGINVGGHHKIEMAELRSLVEATGWQDVHSYIQSGNLVFSARGDETALEAKLEQVIERHFHLSIPVIVRAAAEWSRYVDGIPFTEAARDEPARVMLALSKSPPKPEALRELQERAADGERLAQSGDVLWIYFPKGMGKTKLAPALLDRLVGSPVTARNWSTVLKLQELAALDAQSTKGRE